jgi:hypothetical protein
VAAGCIHLPPTVVGVAFGNTPAAWAIPQNDGTIVAGSPSAGVPGSSVPVVVKLSDGTLIGEAKRMLTKRVVFDASLDVAFDIARQRPGADKPFSQRFFAHRKSPSSLLFDWFHVSSVGSQLLLPANGATQRDAVQLLMLVIGNWAITRTSLGHL